MIKGETRLKGRSDLIGVSAFCFVKEDWQEGGMCMMCRIAGWNREPPANRISVKLWSVCKVMDQ